MAVAIVRTGCRQTVVRPSLAWDPRAIYDSGFSRTAAGVGERFSVAIEVRITGYSKTDTVRHRSLPLIRRAGTIPSASGEQVPQWRLHRSGVNASASHTSDGYRVHWQRSQQIGGSPSPRTRIQRRRRRTACPQRNENAPWSRARGRRLRWASAVAEAAAGVFFSELSAVLLGAVSAPKGIATSYTLRSAPRLRPYTDARRPRLGRPRRTGGQQRGRSAISIHAAGTHHSTKRKERGKTADVTNIPRRRWPMETDTGKEGYN